MHSSAKLAFGIALMWIAGVMFFIAFHPGGVKLAKGTAGNPVDVLKYIISQRAAVGDLGKAVPSGLAANPPGNRPV